MRSTRASVYNRLRRSNGSSALALLLAFAALWLAGCAASANAHRDPDTLIVLELGDADTLSPLFSNNEYSATYEGFVFDALAQVGDDFKMIPDAATSWRSTPDGLHWTVDMRHDLRFSDGVPLTSKDVVFTWQAALDPATGYPYRGQFLYVKKVTAEGPYRVHFDLSNKNALFVTNALNLYILPEHILGKIPHGHIRASDFGEHPVGSGPYVLASWKHDENLTFVPNPHWFGGTPKVKRMIFQIVLNDQARTDAMEQGVADVDDSIPGSAYQIIQGDDKSGRTNLLLLHIPDLYAIFIQVNFRTPGLGDLAVRRAMMYGWDRKDMVDGYYRGDQELATGLTPAGLRRWYDPNVMLYPYDPQRARALLDAAGYRLGPDGVRRKGKLRLSYILDLAGNGGAGQDFGAEFQADMKAIGIAISIRTLDYATWVEHTNAGNYQLAYGGWGGTPDPDEQTFLACDQFIPNGNNMSFYCNPKMDRILSEALQTFDFDKRRALYDRMQEIYAEDVPQLYLYYDYYRAAVSRRVHFDLKTALPGQYLWRDVVNWQLGPL
ncbi:MAG: ABC transporter substrate-binding protein [Vulcanimicrobiaceae bacterium]